MRVIAGTARSLKLKTTPGDATRPTTDKTKETLFNVLQSSLPGSVFVDLYSGSGAIGIEALSRGAKRAYFIENSHAAYQCIIDNLHHTHLEENAVVLKKDALFALQTSINEEIDVLFMDPPYHTHAEREVIKIAITSPYVTEDTLIVAETDLNDDYAYLSELGIEIIKEKRYKTSRHIFMRIKRRNEV